MNKENNSVENLAGTAVDLAESYRDLVALKITEHTSLGISVSVIGIMSLMIAVFVFLFIGLGAAWWIGDYFQDMKIGFFVMGGFYTILFGFILATSEKIWIPKIRNLIIKKIYEKD